MIKQETIDKILKFINDRDWDQFHNSKDLALALSIEASELLEIFLWKSNDEINTNSLKEELADVLMYAILLAQKNKLDLDEIILSKLEINNAKYPVQKAKSKRKK